MRPRWSARGSSGGSLSFLALLSVSVIAWRAVRAAALIVGPARVMRHTHNEWAPATTTSGPKVLHSFGRADQLDRDAIKRLVTSPTRLLDPTAAVTSTRAGGPAGLAFTSCRPVGGTLVLDA